MLTGAQPLYISPAIMETNQIDHANILQDGPRTSNVDPALKGFPTLARWYIDVRDWEANGLDLPLIETLRPAEQQAVKRYHFAADRRMSLSSNLLKYLYVHHACGVPWKDILISRTEMPQNRPYYESKTPTRVEFNVSHQASLTILAGTIAPSNDPMVKTPQAPPPQLGIDITCINERRNKNPTTLHDFKEFVTIFSDVFSPTELATMTNPKQALLQARRLGYANNVLPECTNPDGTEFHNLDSIITYGLRLFYSYWALKEAYLKMTGEALLAPWVKTLEFKNVFPPEPIQLSSSANSNSGCQWGPIYPHVVVTRDGTELQNVRLQLQAFETDFIIATAALGPQIGPIPDSARNEALHHLGSFSTADASGSQKEVEFEHIPLSTRRVVGDEDPWTGGTGVITDPWLPIQEVDVELDIRACAEGRCLHGFSGVGGE
ncbi:4'-phosphopantetheinyl transferase A [Penicillium cosmopolitanum]|uniref:holo-[acyl-carrier-protein] synthase n=1 Tax=Penicillium cosmopolitanum TaxID=1131564 RepID=A0A9W9VPZ5_9EURO|nr:4'-phosphopantetheinyl transferase A [Penicillium cosmopolitanum]KAJ5387114.1 4'-phosphopantetheinyl transferase A [Penicillium cosmopolitanum]